VVGLGDPPPRSAKEVLTRGETRTFVVQALDPPRRGIELALPGLARPAGKPRDETVEAEIDEIEESPSPRRRRQAPSAAAGDGAAAARAAKAAGGGRGRKATPPAGRAPGSATTDRPAEPAPADAPAMKRPSTRAASKRAAAKVEPAPTSEPAAPEPTPVP